MPGEISRRAFLTGATTALNSRTKPARKTIRWKMVTSWPPNLPVFQTGAEELARLIKTMSHGRLVIDVYAGGELVPPLGVFDAVSGGAMEMGHSGALFWAGKLPSAQLFSSIPFGLTAERMNAWLYSGGGLELWNRIYAPFNLVVFPVCNTGVQMGGWFNRKIESIEDFKGLKMRIPGLGGKVLSKAGVNVVLLPAGELYTALERGVIDALEWAGPYHDLKLGFQRAAKYYYYPGWHEPGSIIELMINAKAWNALPADLQAIVASASARSNLMGLAEFDAKNGSALSELVGKHHVHLEKFPDHVLKDLRALSRTTLKELADGDPQFSEIYGAFKKFSERVNPWTEISDHAFMKAKAL